MRQRCRGRRGLISGRSLQLEGWRFQTSPRNGGTAIFDFSQSADERDGVVLCLMHEVPHCHAARIDFH